MKLVEAESTGPVEGDEALVTPPRPPHRRVSVSLIFTLTVLIGTVVAIFLVFPARHDVFMSESITSERTPPAWDLAAPTIPEARAWALGVLGKKAPFPALADNVADVKVIGAKTIDLINKPAALIRFSIGGDEVTYIVQPSRGIAAKHSERTDGDLKAMTWRGHGYTAAAAGPAASSARWAAVVLPH